MSPLDTAHALLHPGCHGHLPPGSTPVSHLRPGDTKPHIDFMLPDGTLDCRFDSYCDQLLDEPAGSCLHHTLSLFDANEPGSFADAARDSANERARTTLPFEVHEVVHARARAALASALACDGETTGWRCSDGNACAHQPHALRRVMLHWKPTAGATGTDAAEDDFFGDDGEPPGGPSETITL